MWFSYERVVLLGDTDAAGVMYFTQLLSICHEAYEHSLLAVGVNLYQYYRHPQWALPVVHARADYKKPLFAGDHLRVQLLAEGVCPTAVQFAIHYDLWCCNALVATATTRHVCIDVQTRRRRPLPEELGPWLALGTKMGGTPPHP
ncbi:MAG: acyl-CoA thioesterase [Oscillatoriales cyanobacterium SM2_2_1]|nr:acyl-CoA thioesterase [Oscillatoriales cyanobacterium SM2_2_1]